MNVIDAWKTAKPGQWIKRARRIDKFPTDNLHGMLKTLTSVDLLADDWYVVKEKKTWTGTWKEFLTMNQLPYTPDAKITVEWEE